MDKEWRVTTPTLIMWGEDDVFFLPEMALEGLEYCDNGRYLVLPGASHWIQHEEPE